MNKSESPRVTFGIIVLNGEPFTRYCLRALYPFAHEIIVVEGAVSDAASIATSDGHSIDGTLETLRHFKAQEDTDGKLQIVVRDGFWKEKDEQSRAYAERATGNYLWQVDIDEFYQPEDMQAVFNILHDNPDIQHVSFRQITFWGGLNYTAEGWFTRHLFSEIFRIFKWEPGYRYLTHRPPTVLNQEGIDLRRLRCISGRVLARRGIYMYHYSLVFPAQVKSKSQYYSSVNWGRFREMKLWESQSYEQLRNPYRVHNTYYYPSWLERYKGSHPPQVLSMWHDIENNSLRFQIQLRRTDDVEKLLASSRYRLGRLVLKAFGPLFCGIVQLPSRMFLALPQSFQRHLKVTVRRKFKNSAVI